MLSLSFKLPFQTKSIWKYQEWPVTKTGRSMSCHLFGLKLPEGFVNCNLSTKMNKYKIDKRTIYHADDICWLFPQMTVPRNNGFQMYTYMCMFIYFNHLQPLEMSPLHPFQVFGKSRRFEAWQLNTRPRCRQPIFTEKPIFGYACYCWNQTFWTWQGHAAKTVSGFWDHSEGEKRKGLCQNLGIHMLMRSPPLLPSNFICVCSWEGSQLILSWIVVIVLTYTWCGWSRCPNQKTSPKCFVHWELRSILFQHGVLRQSRGVFFETAEIFCRRSSKDLNPVHGGWQPFGLFQLFVTHTSSASKLKYSTASFVILCVQDSRHHPFPSLSRFNQSSIYFVCTVVCRRTLSPMAFQYVYCFSIWYMSPSNLINAGYSPRRIVSWGRVVYKQGWGIHHPLSFRNSSGIWRPHAPLEVMPSLKTAEESGQQTAGSHKSRVVCVVDEICGCLRKPLQGNCNTWP